MTTMCKDFRNDFLLWNKSISAWSTVKIPILLNISGAEKIFQWTMSFSWQNERRIMILTDGYTNQITVYAEIIVTRGVLTILSVQAKMSLRELINA